jgi:anti-anti-sigma factor
MAGVPTFAAEAGAGFGFTVVDLDSLRAVICAVGELDLAARDALAEVLDQQAKADRNIIHLDLSQVTFIDCSCLGVLVAAHQRMLDRHGLLAHRHRHLCRASAQAHRLGQPPVHRLPGPGLRSETSRLPALAKHPLPATNNRGPCPRGSRQSFGRILTACTRRNGRFFRKSPGAFADRSGATCESIRARKVWAWSRPGRRPGTRSRH